MNHTVPRTGESDGHSRVRRLIWMCATIALFALVVFLPVFLSGGQFFWIKDFMTFCLGYPLVAGSAALIFGLVWGQVGSSFGIGRLFRSADASSRFFVGFGITLYFSVFWTLIYYDLYFQFETEHINYNADEDLLLDYLFVTVAPSVILILAVPAALRAFFSGSGGSPRARALCGCGWQNSCPPSWVFWSLRS